MRSRSLASELPAKEEYPDLGIFMEDKSKGWMIYIILSIRPYYERRAHERGDFGNGILQ